MSAPDGRILEADAAIKADYVVVGPEVRIQGSPVARDPNTGLALYRVAGSLSLR